MKRERGETPRAHPAARLGASTSMTHLPPNWADRVVIGLNGKPNDQTKRLLMAQQRAEGGDAEWNPCNTTLWLQNFTSLDNYNDVNGVKVRNYLYPNAGVAAHVLTLTQHNSDGTLLYGKLVNELQSAVSSGHTAEQMIANARADIMRWGTNPDTMLEVLKSI